MSRIRPWAVTVGAALLLLAPAGILSSYRLGLLALVAIYAVASLAQNLLAGYADVPSLGNAAFFATGAFVAGALISSGDIATGPALAAGVAAAGLAGLAAGLPALRVSGMPFAILTVALVFVAQELMQQWTMTHQGVGASGGVTVTRPGWLLDDRGLYLASAGAALLTYLAVWNVLRGRTGRAILAVSDNPNAAASIGVSPARYRLIAFVLSGTLTGLAGVAYLYYSHTVTPQSFTLDLSLAFLTMMILGGTRSLAGSALGAVIIGLLPQAASLLPAHVGTIDVRGSVPALYALLLLGAIRFFPEGVWNAAARQWQRS